MKRQIVIWRLIQESLEKQLRVMLLYVLESSGSSPGRQGFFMAVNSDGEMEGSVGGGIMEHKFIEMSKAKLAEGTDEVSIHKQIHNKTAPKNQSGMICSGEQTILLYTIGEKDLTCVEKIITCLYNGHSGTLQLYPNGILFDDILPGTKFSFDYINDEDWIYKELIGLKNQLYIVGGGHCSLALCKIMRTMDFHITVFDERKNLNTVRKNVFAHKVEQVENYTIVKEKIPSGKNSYVVVMTLSYRTDDIVLRNIMAQEYKYIGVMGSKNKIEKMFSDYKNEGIADKLLSRIHAPIGINIKSETPQEIAISIAAEIIKVKNASG